MNGSQELSSKPATEQFYKEKSQNVHSFSNQVLWLDENFNIDLSCNYVLEKDRGKKLLNNQFYLDWVTEKLGI